MDKSLLMRLQLTGFVIISYLVFMLLLRAFLGCLMTGWMAICIAAYWAAPAAFFILYIWLSHGDHDG